MGNIAMTEEGREAPDMQNATREDVNRLSDKIDELHNVFVTRAEYATMHTTLSALISSVAAQVTTLNNEVTKNREAAEQTKTSDTRWFLERIEGVEQRLVTKLDAQDTKIDAQFEHQSTQLTAKSQWKTGVVWAVIATILSGGLTYLLPHIIH